MNGKKLYEGEFENDKLNGKGIEYYLNGKIWYNGNWVDGIRDGEGLEYYENGKILFVGTWKKNQKINGIMYDEKGNVI